MKKLTVISLIIVMAVSATLLLTGCPRHIDSLYGVKVIGDGNGGAFTIYEDKLGGNIYLQKISLDGEPVWGDKGMLLGVSRNQWAYSFANTHIVSDGSGGAIIAWPENRSSSQPVEPTYQIIKLDFNGQTVFSKVYERIDQIVSDGSGGVIFDFSLDEKTLSVVRIDFKGDLSWGREGIALPRSGNTRQIASTVDGGAAIVWLESHYPPDAEPGDARLTTHHIFAQKIDSQGRLAWGDGLLLYVTPQGTWAEDPHIISDGAGGAIIDWHQWPNVPVRDGSPEAILNDVYIQKVDSTGKILWQENGLPLKTSQVAERAFAIEPRPVSDGSGGAIVIWRDMRNSTGNTANLFAQRIDAEGNIMWQPGGINVSADAINPNHTIISDGAGTSYVAYFFSEPRKNLHVQKVDSDGKTLWSENGVLVAGGDYAGYSLASDGQGGVIIGWGVGKGTFSSEKAFVQRISADGKVMWGEGIMLKK